MENIENTPLANAQYSGALADEITRLNRELKQWQDGFNKYKTLFHLLIQDICDYRWTSNSVLISMEEVADEYYDLYDKMIIDNNFD